MNVNSRRAVGVIVGSDFSDPTNERLIYLSAAGLVLLGAVLFIGTALWWRRGRQEHPALSPLEVMGERRWAKASDGDRRRRLDHVRLAGAGAAANQQVVAEPVDLEALDRRVPQAFDDLREPDVAVPEPPEGAEPENRDVEVVDHPEDAAADGGSVEVEGDADPPESDEPGGDDDAGVATVPDATSMSAERPPDPLAGVQSPAAADDGAEAIAPPPPVDLVE